MHSMQFLHIDVPIRAFFVLPLLRRCNRAQFKALLNSEVVSTPNTGSAFIGRRRDVVRSVQHNEAPYSALPSFSRDRNYF